MKSFISVAALAAVSGTCALLLTPAGAGAGPLDPPPGPVAPTPGPEPRTAVNAVNTPGDADSLFKITQPGSYYLTGNITGVANKHGIEITTSGVTLDLNGFDLSGIPGMGAFDGVSVTVAFLSNITVRNGSVRNWGDEGVDLGTLISYNLAVADVRASGNAGNGIAVANGSIVSGCTAYANGGDGILASRGSTIFACSASYNTGDGIDASTGCTIVACSVSYNTGNGIRANAGSTISGCAASYNTGNGIYASGSHIVGNTCDSNGNGGVAAGIYALFDDSRIEGNHCTRNDIGIDVVGAGNIILRNTCAENVTNYRFVADNRYGPVVNITATGTPAISGNSAADTSGTTHPWANFAY